MTNICWDDSLSVGVDLIDEQHKMLISHLNEISTAVENKLGVEKIMKTMDFLLKYTDFHFGTEEKHMNELNYPGLDFHLEQHGEFKTTLNNLIEDFREDGSTEPLAKAIETFLFNWLVKHIKDVDQQFGDFLTEKGITPTE